MRTEQEANLAIEKYADMVRRICLVNLKNSQDTEDVFQEVFLKYILHDKEFESDAHEKAWLIRVTINACKDLLKQFFRRRVTSLEALVTEPTGIREESWEVLDAVIQLPAKYRDVIYLHYYEGYTAVEIASIFKKNENTIYTWLSRGKEQLKSSLGGEFFGK